MSEDLHPRLAEAWASRGLTVADLEIAADQTLAADRGPASPSAAATQTRTTEVFERVSVLGHGGMGVVHLARQPSLRREIALKCLVDPTPRGVSALLKEAWVAGALDHPNIVPVHTVALDDGAPALAMKRVEGTSWAALIEDPTLHPRARSDESPWDRHLAIFLQVCDAVRFAHSRGILHLDLKPENVMVGLFGEVYVVDWGLAAGVDDHPDWLLPAASIRGVAGTPAYMAPELAAADSAQIGTATDVYLLGATLHEALTGEPRHRSNTLLGNLASAVLSEPFAYGPEVNPELAAILNKACHVEPKQRFESVTHLRDALEDHERHGESNRLAAEAQASLEAVRQLPADAAELRDEETRCRLLIEQCSGRWPENPRAQSTRTQLVEELLRKALEREELPVAERLATELPAVDPALEAGLATLREQRRAERSRHTELTALEDELDVSRALVERRRLFLALGLLWFVGNLGLGYVDRSPWGPIGYRELLAEGVFIVLFFVPYFFVQRRIFFQNLVNARIQQMLLLTGVLTEVLFLGGLVTDVPAATAIGVTPLLYAFGFSAVAIAVDRRLAVGAAFQLLAFFLVGALPEWGFEIIGTCGLLSAASTWRWPAPRGKPGGPPLAKLGGERAS